MELSAAEGDNRSLFAVQGVGVALKTVRKVGSWHGFESEDDASWLNAGQAEEEPLAKVKGRTRDGCIVVVPRVVLESLGAWIEVRNAELPGCGPEKCVLLVDRLERGDVSAGQADRDDHGG